MYLVFFQFSGKETPQKILYETSPIRIWCILRNSHTLVSFSYHGKRRTMKASLKQSKFRCGAFSSMRFSFHKSNQIRAIFFSWYAARSTLLTPMTCIKLNTFFNFLTMFSRSSIVLELVKLGGLILRNSRILEVSISTCQESLFRPTMSVIV